jgi:hypothetical protein
VGYHDKEAFIFNGGTSFQISGYAPGIIVARALRP